MLSPRCASLVATLALLTVPSVGRADPEDLDDDARWYGWQVAMVDAGAIGLVGQALLEHKPLMVVGALGVWATGAPFVHGSNATTLRAVASLALRVGVPLALGAVGGRMEPRGAGPCGGISCTSDAAAGTALGLVAVSLFDAVLARSSTARAEPDPMAGGWSIAPLVLAGREQTTFGLAGAF